MGLSVLTEPSSPTARAQAMLSPLAGGGAAGGLMSPKVRALIAEAPGGSMPPPCSPKRSALTADDLEIYTGVFRQFDADGGGTISASELGNVLDMLGVSVDAKTVTKMMSEVDDDSSGEIDLKEFLAMMAKNVSTQAPLFPCDF